MPGGVVQTGWGCGLGLGGLFLCLSDSGATDDDAGTPEERTRRGNAATEAGQGGVVLSKMLCNHHDDRHAGGGKGEHDAEALLLAGAAENYQARAGLGGA